MFRARLVNPMFSCLDCTPRCFATATHPAALRVSIPVMRCSPAVAFARSVVFFTALLMYCAPL